MSELVIHLSDAQIEHYLGFVYKRISGYRSARFLKFLIFIELFECIAIAVSFPLFSILYFNTLFFFYIYIYTMYHYHHPYDIMPIMYRKQQGVCCFAGPLFGS